MAASLDNQRKTLEEQAKHEGPMGDWARRMLLKLFPPPADPTSPATAPQVSMALGEPPKIKDAVATWVSGEFGNCKQCQSPFDTRAKRTPMHEAGEVIFLCRPCADKRWREINSQL